MSLALAKILWKGNGNDSVDRLRKRHAHHGLAIQAPAKMPRDFREAASAIRAPAFVGSRGERVGTFEVWHKYSRHLPIAGERSTLFKGGGRQSGAFPILVSHDSRPSLLPPEGISLLDCVVSLPAMREYVTMVGLSSRLVRATVRETIDHRSDITRIEQSIVVHPHEDALIRTFQEGIRFDANAVDQISYIESPSSFVVRWSFRQETDDVYAEFPEGFSIRHDEVQFLGYGMPLNELGYFYVALYMLGMLSRYYPDLWHREIDNSTDLSIIAECLLDVASQRIPLLVLGELESKYYLLRYGERRCPRARPRTVSLRHRRCRACRRCIRARCWRRFLSDHGLGVGDAATRLGVSRQTLHRLLAGQQRVSAEMALRLGRLCGNGPEIWLHLQAQYDLARARARSGQELEAVEPLV